jgi:hypothetical protein
LDRTFSRDPTAPTGKSGRDARAPIQHDRGALRTVAMPPLTA